MTTKEKLQKISNRATVLIFGSSVFALFALSVHAPWAKTLLFGMFGLSVIAGFVYLQTNYRCPACRCFLRNFARNWSVEEMLNFCPRCGIDFSKKHTSQKDMEEVGTSTAADEPLHDDPKRKS